MRTILIGAALLLASFGLGMWTAQKYYPKIVHQIEVQTKTVEVEKVKFVDRIIYKTKTITKPDGTKIEVKTEDKIITKVEVKEKVVEKLITPPSTVPNNWVLGVGFDPLIRKPTNIDLGYRVMGPIWTNVNANWQHHNLTVGLRVEF
jgi:hypothetical protein